MMEKRKRRRGDERERGIVTEGRVWW